eukprot:355246-Chlamydomonas_euryale.AAC.2
MAARGARACAAAGRRGKGGGRTEREIGEGGKGGMPGSDLTAALPQRPSGPRAPPPPPPYRPPACTALRRGPRAAWRAAARWRLRLSLGRASPGEAPRQGAFNCHVASPARAAPSPPTPPPAGRRRLARVAKNDRLRACVVLPRARGASRRVAASASGAARRQVRRRRRKRPRSRLESAGWNSGVWVDRN